VSPFVLQDLNLFFLAFPHLIFFKIIIFPNYHVFIVEIKFIINNFSVSNLGTPGLAMYWSAAGAV